MFDASIKVAGMAKFKPFTLSGKPTKRSGVIVYDFPKIGEKNERDSEDKTNT